MTTQHEQSVLRDGTGVLLPEGHRAARGAGAADVTGDRRGSRRLLRPYVARAVALDLLAIGLAGSAGALADSSVLAQHGLGGALGLRPPVALLAVWVFSLLVLSVYEAHIVGSGPEEYKRVTGAALLALGVFATISYFAGVEGIRRFLALALPVGLVLMLSFRFLLRGWLTRSRAKGRFLNRTVVVGQGRHAEELENRLRRDSYAGFEVVGRIDPPSRDEAVEEWLDFADATLTRLSADAVAVAEMSGIDSDLVRRLSWRIEGPRMDLLVSPAMSDFAGPRLSIRPASGLPLIHLDEPQLNGPKSTVKRVVDVVVGGAILLAISPLLLLVAILIKLTSKGPVLYAQRRVGQHGEPFSFLKFRSMVVGAHDLRDDVIGTPDDDISERYRADPRITRVGRFLRRWSIDELPQLLHVVTGEMSLVGPRPLLLDELPLLVDTDHRRHLTKPGLTGLWQVSGRKDVEWEERMRLDLWYVENWSPALDMVILLRTARAVLSGHGAY